MVWKYLFRDGPLKMLLIGLTAILLNVALVLGLQVLLQYRYTSPIDDIAVLGKMDDRYEDSTLIDIAFADPGFYSGNSANKQVFFLVETRERTLEVVTVEQHCLFTNRFCICKDACTELEPTADAIHLKCGTANFTLSVTTKESTGQPDIAMYNYSGTDGSSRFWDFLFLSVIGLSIAELAVYIFMFKRYEIT